MTKRYCEVADVDVKNSHMTASAMDNITSTMGQVNIARIKTARTKRIGPEGLKKSPTQFNNTNEDRN